MCVTVHKCPKNFDPTKSSTTSELLEVKHQEWIWTQGSFLGQENRTDLHKPYAHVFVIISYMCADPDQKSTGITLLTSWRTDFQTFLVVAHLASRAELSILEALCSQQAYQLYTISRRVQWKSLNNHPVTEPGTSCFIICPDSSTTHTKKYKQLYNPPKFYQYWKLRYVIQFS